MIKRMSKVTALMVAAASIISIVPAMAADTTTRLGTQQGTIESAVAFKDGNYAFEGYKTSSDDKSVYFSTGNKDKDLTNITNATIEGAYGDKYAYAEDGSNEYLVDLTNGSVIDDSTPADQADTAASKLKSTLKKTDRYGDAVVVDSSKLSELSGAKFGSVWYSYAINPTNGKLADNDVNGTLYGYTDGAGKYIDASNIANVYAYSSTKQKVVRIDNFSNKANDANADSKLQATLVNAPKYLGQDKDNIYQEVTVKITDSNGTTTSVGSVANIAVNFPTSTSDVAFKGTYATETINWNILGASKFTTSGSVQIAGVQFNYNATPAAATDYKDLATLQAAVKTAFTGTPAAGYAYSNGVFTASSIGHTADFAQAGDTTDLVAYNDGKTASFTVGGQTFNYNATPAAATDYKDLATLQTAVDTYFKAHPVSNYYYNNGVFTYSGTGTPAASDISGATTFNAAVTGGVTTAGKTYNATYIQKISKAQGDTKDDAYLPKTVEAYEISSNYDSGDTDDAVDAINAATSFQVTNGVLYAIDNTGSNVKVTALSFKKDKVKFDASNAPANLTADSKVDVYLVEKGNNDNVDVAATAAVSTDVNGNVWALHEGTIYEFDGANFTAKYTCDRSFDRLDVYDANSLIAWDSNGDAYTTVAKGGDTTTTPVVTTGWVKLADGTWNYNDTLGNKVANKWVNDGGVWYFLKADGAMATGWYNDNGTWYYLNQSGAMKTGWINDNGTWYYLASSGAMKTGWIYDGANWYYLSQSGAMLANTSVDGYKLGATGAWVK